MANWRGQKWCRRWCTAVGLICVNIAELRHGLGDVDLWRYGSGILLAFISVACWAWYALRNARWLRENPDKHPMMWATAQALVTLPVSAWDMLARASGWAISSRTSPSPSGQDRGCLLA
jgi:drug/metabolite transporter (DMT)-like permease